MVTCVTHAMHTDPSLYIIAAQNIQGIELSKSISKVEKLDAICKIYQQLINLEEKRQENPLCLQVNQHCFYVRFVDGSVNTATTKRYNYSSLFSQVEFEKGQKELMKQLDELDGDQFVKFLNDDVIESTDEEKKTLNQLMTLHQNWEKLMEINAKDFIRLNEELKQQKSTDG